MIGEHWISDVVRRCEKLLISMAQEAMVNKSSIEERRSKEPNDALYVAVAKP